MTLPRQSNSYAYSDGRMVEAKAIYVHFRYLWRSDAPPWERLSEAQRKSWADFVAPWIDYRVEFQGARE